MSRTSSSNRSICRAILIFTILANTGIGGFFDTESLIFFGLPLFDYSTLLLIVYYFYTCKRRDNRFATLSPVRWVLLIVTIVILSMPFRGNETLLQAFQTGRRFYVLLLTFVVMDEIKYEGNMQYIRKILFGFAYYYAFLSIFNYLMPGIISTIWAGIGSLDDLKGDVQRHVLKANDGLLFVHLGFILQLSNILIFKKYRNKNNIVSLAILFLAVFMMGFRAVMMATLFASVFCAFLIRKKLYTNRLLSSGKIFKISIVVVISIFLIDIVLGNALSNTLNFASGELSGSESGTLQGRLNRSLLYQIPMFLLNPLFGVGLVSATSKMALDLGYIRDIDYTQSLYYFDFGYGTMLVMFGLVGSFFIIRSFIISIVANIKSVKEYMDPYSLSCASFIVALLVCNYSFGALETCLGLLPLSIIIGAATSMDVKKARRKMELKKQLMIER